MPLPSPALSSPSSSLPPTPSPPSRRSKPPAREDPTPRAPRSSLASLRAVSHASDVGLDAATPQPDLEATAQSDVTTPEFDIDAAIAALDLPAAVRQSLEPIFALHDYAPRRATPSRSELYRAIHVPSFCVQIAPCAPCTPLAQVVPAFPALSDATAVAGVTDEADMAPFSPVSTPPAPTLPLHVSNRLAPARPPPASPAAAAPTAPDTMVKVAAATDKAVVPHPSPLSPLTPTRRLKRLPRKAGVHAKLAAVRRLLGRKVAVR